MGRCTCMRTAPTGTRKRAIPPTTASASASQDRTGNPSITSTTATARRWRHWRRRSRRQTLLRRPEEPAGPEPSEKPLGRNGPREDLRQLHRAHHPLGTTQDGGCHPGKRPQILVGIRHAGQSGDLLQGPLQREIQGHFHHSYQDAEDDL